MFRKAQYWCLVAFAALLIPNCYSQTTFGSIVGTVTDPSGAPIANGKVNLTNLGTGAQQTAPTNNQGLYQFLNLTPGQYKIGVKQSGFKSFLRSPVTVQTETSTRINIALQVGELSQTVEVTAQTPLLQPQSSSLGQVISQRTANTLPLNGRNPMNLVSLVPSVVPQGGSMSNPNGQNPFAWGNYQIGGGMANQSTMWLDGAPVNAAYINLTALIPTQDSLEQFKVSTNNLSPQYGRFAGGVVNFITKSGTNKVHGTLWEYIRNRDLDANDFFSNSAGTPRGSFTQNQFGFNLGGPLYIPKIYNGKNKTFFFVDYEGFRLRQGLSSTQTMPTALERTGDLSGLAASQGVDIYDPLTTCGTEPGNNCASGVAPGSRTQFPGNIIPANRLNPTSQTYLNTIFPLPNAPGNAQGVGNWIGNGSQGGGNNETVVHIDQNISDRQHLSARYTYWGNLNLPIEPMNNGICQDRCTETFNTNNFVLGDTYTFTPTTIMAVHLSYQRFSYNRIPVTLGYDLTTLGWPAVDNSEAAFDVLPVPSINGFDTQNTYGSQGTGSVIVARNDNYRAAGTVTKIVGNHTFTMGAQFLRLTDNYGQANNPTGGFSFNPDLTAANALNTAGSGLGLATFLLGYPSSGNVLTPGLIAGQQLYSALFLNDSWHVRSNLTINVGIRWEHAGPWTERFNRISFFDPNQANQVLATDGISAPGNVDLVDSSADSYRSSIRPDWKQFSPRVGLAYQFAHNMVFHAGYGIFWLPNDVDNAQIPNNDPINSFSTPYLASVFPGIPAGTISDPFPGGIIAPPGRDPSYAQTLLGTGVGENQLPNPYGYAQQWNADIQKQFGEGFLLDVAYGASKGTHLPIDAQIDQMPDQDLSLGNALFTTVANPYYPYVTAPGSSLSQPTVQASQLLTPYPEYTGISYAGEGIGNSTYESLQVKAQERFSGGNMIMVAYTHSKLISDTGTLTGWLEAGGTGGVQDWNNLNAEKSLASFDTPDRLVVSYVLDVPVGKGRKYLPHANAFVNATLGGWGVEGVSTFQSGFPLHLTTNSGNINSPNAGTQRPNVASGCDVFTSGSATQRLDDWFNTSCFTQPAAFTYGDEPRNDPHLLSPGMANFDFSLFKNFAILPEDRAHIQFRAEFFNLFNRVQFGYPGQALGASNFGQITSQANLPRLIQFALRLAF
ncbi:MAG: carboxypeptidase regulatory-like domain-containing protein [Terriglobia bacterium]